AGQDQGGRVSGDGRHDRERHWCHGSTRHSDDVGVTDGVHVGVYVRCCLRGDSQSAKATPGISARAAGPPPKNCSTTTLFQRKIKCLLFGSNSRTPLVLLNSIVR